MSPIRENLDMAKSAEISLQIRPGILIRMAAIFGSANRFGKVLKIADSQPCQWKAIGYIPEVWALRIHRLRARDEYGLITAMDVLTEAEAVKQKRLRDAGLL